MANFTKTYGMVGVGIVAAIGFVFALSYLSPSGGGLNQPPLQDQSSPSTFSLKQETSPQPPLSDNNSGESASTFSSPNGSGASMMESSRINESGGGLTLTSLVALTSSHEMIGEIGDGMEFKLGVPVFLHASLQNTDAKAMSNHTVILDVKPQGQKANENIAEFRGDVSGGSNVTIESYWHPTSTGDYVITVFIMSVDDMASTIPASPIAAIHVKVIE